MRASISVSEAICNIFGDAVKSYCFVTDIASHVTC